MSSLTIPPTGEFFPPGVSEAVAIAQQVAAQMHTALSEPMPMDVSTIGSMVPPTVPPRDTRLSWATVTTQMSI